MLDVTANVRGAKVYVDGTAIGRVPLKKPAGKPSIELFNLDNDPSEKTNLVSKEPKQAAAMLADLREHYRLKIAGIPHYRFGAEDFVAPKDWVIEE